MSAARRVVTGLNEAGKSCVIVDGPPIPMAPGYAGGFVWRADSLPADNSGTDDIAIADFSFDKFHDGGANFMHVVMPPNAGDVFLEMHTTDTLDFVVMLKGEVTLVLEAGETKLSAGQFVVDRGVHHAWRNDGPDDAEYVVITLPAHPVGKGRTV
jgi:mannose-6-phosphate isomerase-like protein (cupin superfamily)